MDSRLINRSGINNETTPPKKKPNNTQTSNNNKKTPKKETTQANKQTQFQFIYFINFKRLACCLYIHIYCHYLRNVKKLGLVWTSLTYNRFLYGFFLQQYLPRCNSTKSKSGHANHVHNYITDYL